MKPWTWWIYRVAATVVVVAIILAIDASAYYDGISVGKAER